MRSLLGTGRQSTDGRLLKSSLTLISGTVVSQAILFFCSPILSRLFDLADFGNLASYNAWVSVLALLGTLRYEHALVITENRESASRVLALTLVLCAASCAACAAAVGITRVFETGGPYLQDIRGFVPYIPVGVFSIGVSSALIQLKVRAGGFRTLAAVALVQVVVTVFCQVGLGLLHASNGLILGTIAGSSLTSGILTWLYVREGGLTQLRRAMTVRQLWATAREHLNFPKYTLAADALGLMVQQFTPVFVLALFDPAVAGSYAFSIRNVRTPLLVVSTALNSALRREGVDHLNRDGSLRPLFSSIVKSLLLLGCGPFVIIALFGERLFRVIFGAQWTNAGRIVQILSPGILLEFVAFPLSVFFLLTGSQRYALALKLSGFVCLVGALLFGKYYLNDFMATCYLLSAVMVLVNLGGIILSGRVSGGKDPRRAGPALGGPILKREGLEVEPGWTGL